MNLLGLIPDVLKTIGKITGIGIFNDAGDALAPEKVSALPPETQLALTTALQKHQEAMRGFDIEELKTYISESLAEINSTDKYTSRARPTGVYAATIITFLMAVGMLCGIKLDTSAVAELMLPLWGSAGYYTYSRTKEKLATTKANGA